MALALSGLLPRRLVVIVVIVIVVVVVVVIVVIIVVIAMHRCRHCQGIRLCLSSRASVCWLFFCVVALFSSQSSFFFLVGCCISHAKSLSPQPCLVLVAPPPPGWPPRLLMPLPCLVLTPLHCLVGLVISSRCRLVSFLLPPRLVAPPPPGWPHRLLLPPPCLVQFGGKLILGQKSE